MKYRLIGHFVQINMKHSRKKELGIKADKNELEAELLRNYYDPRDSDSWELLKIFILIIINNFEDK